MVSPYLSSTVVHNLKRKSCDEPVSRDMAPTPRAIKQLKRSQYGNDSLLISSAPWFMEQHDHVPGPSYSDRRAYPSFELYPKAPDPNAMDIDIDSPSPMTSSDADTVSLLQPQDTPGVKHHSCLQIPRLQIANYPGLDGRRAMFSHCQQCGAISIMKKL